MARKGQKFKRYSADLKMMAVEDYLKHKYSMQTIARKYNISSVETVLRWAQAYTEKGEAAFQENRGKATKEDSPFKGRPRVRFVSKDEEEEYNLRKKQNLQKKAISAEEDKINSHKL